MYSYSPMTEQECNQERGYALLPDGVYNFDVLAATYKTSKSTGNPMIELKLRIWDSNGKEHIVFDYLVSTSKMMWKTKHFCDSVGLTKEYEDSKFNESLCPGKDGKAEIVYQIGSKKPDGTSYKDKNAVSDYVKRDKEAIQKDEDIPF